MAKKKENGSNGTADHSLPAGYRRVVSISDAPWFHLEEGNVMRGKVNNRFIMNTEPKRAYYQVELLGLREGAGPTKVRQGRGDDAEVVEAASGDVINLGESYKAQVLKDQVIPGILAGGEYEIYVVVGAKVKAKGGRTLWDLDIGVKETKAPTRPLQALPADEAGAGDEGGEEAAF